MFKATIVVRPEIKEVEIISKTEKFVTLPEDSSRGKRRVAIEDSYYKFFDAYADAKAWIVETLEKRIWDTKQYLESLEDKLDMAKSLSNEAE